ncbi:MAG: pyridoxamine 5'-phosphate oxidase family protein [Bacteroidota bacterium]
MEYPKTTRNKVKRIPKRGHYDQKTIFEILDAGYLCHLGFVMDEQPFVIPTIYGRKDDIIYLHGASTSRMLVHLSSGAPLCMTKSQKRIICFILVPFRPC